MNGVSNGQNGHFNGQNGHKVTAPSYIAMNEIPTVDQLSHVNQLLEAIQQQPRTRTNITAVATQPLYIGGGLQPIPEKLVRRIQDGHYINRAEMLPVNLEASNATDDDSLQLQNGNYQMSHKLWIGFSALVSILQ